MTADAPEKNKIQQSEPITPQQLGMSAPISYYVQLPNGVVVTNPGGYPPDDYSPT